MTGKFLIYIIYFRFYSGLIILEFFNSYEDKFRASEYSKLEFQNTYYLAYRDLSGIFKTYIKGKRAVDFGCGTGRSTRFLQKHGFDVIGIDISSEMINIARKIDPNGKYYLIEDEDYKDFNPYSYDLVFSAFTFDNIPMGKKENLFSTLSMLLDKKGKLINIVSSPEMYTREWASFSTKDFPENKNAKNGDIVMIITKDFKDKRPCYDIFCSDSGYKKIYSKVGLKLIKTFRPLAKGDEPFSWINETKIPPWIVYVLNR